MRVVALVAAFNEEDVIGAAIRHLIAQGVLVYLIDHSSTDATVAEAERFLGRGLLKIEHFPEESGAPIEDRDRFAWGGLLRRKEELAQKLDFDWFIHHDADELRESPWSHLGLRDAIDLVDRLGWNAIDHEVIEFCPTDDSFRQGDDLREHFQLCRHGLAVDKLQIKCWKKQPARVDLVTNGGHDVTFPGRKVFPIRFLIRHYPIRGQTHGERKVFRERRGRFVPEEIENHWHLQYDGIAQGHSFLADEASLVRYDAETLRTGLALRHRDIEELEAKLTAAQEMNRSLAHDLATQERETERLRELERNSNARAEELAARLQEQLRLAEASRTEVASLQSEIELLRREIEARGTQIERIHASASWRLTGPARAILKAIRGY